MIYIRLLIAVHDQFNENTLWDEQIWCKPNASKIASENQEKKKRLNKTNYYALPEIKWPFLFKRCKWKPDLWWEMTWRESEPWSCIQQDWCPQWRLCRASGIWPRRYQQGDSRKYAKGGNCWKDKCVGTLWRTQKCRLSPGNNMIFFPTLNPWWIEYNFILCWCGVTVSVLVRFVVAQYLENLQIKLSSALLYLEKCSWTGMQLRIANEYCSLKIPHENYLCISMTTFQPFWNSIQCGEISKFLMFELNWSITSIHILNHQYTRALSIEYTKYWTLYTTLYN